MSSINWDQEWVITTAGGGLSVGDKIRFESLQFMHEKSLPPYGTKSLGTYTPVLTPTITSCTVTIAGTTYKVDYKDNDPSGTDELICTSSSDSYSNAASAMSGLGFLSWVLGGFAGLGLGLGISLLLDVPCGSALAISFASAFAAAIVSKVVADRIPPDGTDGGPGGTSWTAEEGG